MRAWSSPKSFGWKNKIRPRRDLHRLFHEQCAHRLRVFRFCGDLLTQEIHAVRQVPPFVGPDQPDALEQPREHAARPQHLVEVVVAADRHHAFDHAHVVRDAQHQLFFRGGCIAGDDCSSHCLTPLLELVQQHAAIFRNQVLLRIHIAEDLAEVQREEFRVLYLLDDLRGQERAPALLRHGDDEPRQSIGHADLAFVE